MISPSQRPLPTQHTTNTRDEHPWPSAGFEPAIPAIDQPRTYKLGPCGICVDCSNVNEREEGRKRDMKGEKTDK